MIKSKYRYIILLLLTLSCSSEKINLSPIGDSVAQPPKKEQNYTAAQKKNLIFYSSQLTNLTGTFPKFKNDAVNKEVVQLKYYLKDYIGAMVESNEKGLKKSQKNFERSYQKIQHLRKYLNKNDDEVLNRYLVRIKINMALLNSNISSPESKITP